MTEKNYADIANKLYNQLEQCCIEPGAEITISINKKGIKTEYSLYDHAALVQGLMIAVDEFINEL